jgi:predicted nucleotidyltransferase
MRVLGFREAFAHTITVRLPGPVEVQVVSPAGLAILKLLAWEDRRHEFPTKDAQDFALVARTYLEAGNRDRLFDQFISLVEAEDFDYQLAGARMLGHDMAAIADEQALAEIRKILSREADVMGNLALARAMGRVTEQAVEMIENILAGVNDRALNGTKDA